MRKLFLFAFLFPLMLQAQTYNVKDAPFNAVMDGVTDDGVAFAKAIDSAAAHNGTVYIPAGSMAIDMDAHTYLFSNTVTLAGAGRTSSFIVTLPATATQTTHLLRTAANSTVTFRDFTVTGPGVSNGAYSITGIRFGTAVAQAGTIYVRNVQFQKFTFSIGGNDGTETIDVDSCYFNNSNRKGTGILLGGSRLGTLLVNHSSFDSIGNDLSMDHGIYIGDNLNMLAQNSTFKHIYGFGIQCYGGSIGNAAYKTIINCVVDSTWGWFMTSADPNTMTIISACTLGDADSSTTEGIYRGISKLIFTGNTLTRSGYSMRNWATSASARTSKVYNNTFTSFTGNAIYSYDAGGLNIVYNNTFTGATAGLNATGTGNGAVIQTYGNTLNNGAVLTGNTPITAQPNAVYYISSTGNDLNPGITSATPWQTPNRVSATALLPGDSILCSRGDTLNGMFNLTPIGTEAHPIVIGAYGTGANPVIRGDFFRNTWTALVGMPGYYSTPCQYGVVNTLYQRLDTGWTENHTPSSYFIWSDDRKATLEALAQGTMAFRSKSTSPYPLDTIFYHAYNNKTVPTNKDSLKIYYDQHYFQVHSKYTVIRDLKFLYSGYGLLLEGVRNFTVRNVQFSNSLHGAMYISSSGDTVQSYNCLVDSCTADTTGNTIFYIRASQNNVIRYNTILGVYTTVDGLVVGGDQAGVGLQGSSYNRLDSVQNNTWEYNTLTDSPDGSGGFDYYWSWGDTVRFNRVSGNTGGFFPHGTALVMNNNTFQGTGTSARIGNGTEVSTRNLSITYNVFSGIKGDGMYVSASSGTATYSNNYVNIASPDIQIFWSTGATVTASNNTYWGTSGKWSNGAGPTDYATLALYQAATSNETGSTYAVGAPTIPVPTLASPADGATSQGVTPTLAWNRVAGAPTYRVQVSTSSGFGTTVYDDSTWEAQKVSSTLQPATVYYWRVATTTATPMGGSAWATTRSFNTGLAGSSNKYLLRK